MKKGVHLKRAIFPLIMAGISLLVFAIAYYSVTVGVVKPYYGAGLVFLLPFCGFLVIAAVMAHTKEVTAGIYATVSMTILSAMVVLFAGVCFSLHAATTTVTDTECYARAHGVINESLAEPFPNAIPENATEVEMLYIPRFMQGAEELRLRFKADDELFAQYTEQLAAKAIWHGAVQDLDEQKYGMSSYSPEAISGDDAEFYLFAAVPEQAQNWNHGKRAYVIALHDSNTLLFSAAEW